MKSVSSALLTIVFIFISKAALAQSPPPFEFSGEVNQGQAFTYDLPEGLQFSLNPHAGEASENVKIRSDGWEIGVQNQIDTSSLSNGPNPADIIGWHFCSSSSDTLPFGLLERHLKFTVSDNDAQKLKDQYWCKRRVDDKCSMSSERHNENACKMEEMGKCDDLFHPRELIYLTLRITSYVLDKSPAYKFCFIKSIKFHVSGEFTPSKEE